VWCARDPAQADVAIPIGGDVLNDRHSAKDGPTEHRLELGVRAHAVRSRRDEEGHPGPVDLVQDDGQHEIGREGPGHVADADADGRAGLDDGPQGP
jgi:hypothetical protein